MLQPLKVFHKNRRGFARNRDAGMSYLNRMLIEEESQFECYGVHEIQTPEIISNLLLNLNVGHIIIAADKYYRKIFFEALSTTANYTLTIIESERLECVQNEKVKKVYKESKEMMYEKSAILKAYKPTGDDVDDLFERIKRDEIKPNHLYPYFEEKPRFLGMFSAPWVDDFSGFGETGSCTYHISMLSEDDEKYLTSIPARNHFKMKMKLSKVKTNFALSICSRKTYLLRDGFLHGIKEPDPWQKEIIQNYVEFEKNSKKQKKHEETIKFISYDDYMNDFPDSE